MDDDRNPPIRIIVKKKGHGGGHHGGAWKVAYADFVTAMMALFIVLWIVGQNSSVKQAISMYFNDPGVFSGGTSAGGIHSGTAPVSPPKPENVIVGNVEAEMDKLKAEGKKIEGKISSVAAFEKFKDKIEISVTRDGMRIELIEDSKGLFFDIGSAKVKDETIRLLKLIAAEVGKLPNNIIVEGYTDARPFVSENYSNWELSVDRANAARKLLEEYGVKKNQVLEVRGYADRYLKLPDKPLDHANRRVNIIVTIPKQLKTDKPNISGPEAKIK